MGKSWDSELLGRMKWWVTCGKVKCTEDECTRTKQQDETHGSTLIWREDLRVQCDGAVEKLRQGMLAPCQSLQLCPSEKWYLHLEAPEEKDTWQAGRFQK